MIRNIYMRDTLYGMVYFMFYLFSRLPYRALYAVSDLMYLVVYHAARYRRRVVRRNLASSFPEMSDKERLSLERRFYHWLCDYAVETIKLMSVSEAELLKHIEFRGVELLEKYFEEGRSCAAILGHYGNWELLSATGLAFKRRDEAVCGLIYHPLRNHLFDRLFIKLRQSMGGLCVRKQDIPRYLISFKEQGIVSLFGYIADQSPKYKNIHLWLPFLNHDTPVFTGGERLMRKMDNAVFYVDVEHPSRGKYVFTFRLMTDDPNSKEEHWITREFFSLLERTIRRDPTCYLWTHNRWKRDREKFDKEYKIENGRTVKR